MATTTVCRVCFHTDLIPVLDLGDQHLSDFRDDDEKPPRFPLNLLFCPACYLAQLDTTVPRDLMYHDRYGFKSGVNNTIRADHRDTVATALRHRPGARSWLDIASNDGTLLSYVPASVYRAGIDPVTKYCLEAHEHADRIVNDYFDAAHFGEARFDVITSISMFYDLDDPNEFVAAVKGILADGGVWVVQQNYLLDTLRLNAVDNVCHEHITYFSLLAMRNLLDRHGLEVFHVSTSTVNGGSFRTLIGHRGAHTVDDTVTDQLAVERDYGLDTAAPFEAFNRRVENELARLRAFVHEANGSGKSVYIYGASTRGGTLWQAARLDVSDLPFAVERNPEKVGRKIASIGVPIISEDEARDRRPDYMLVSPWFFRDEFVEREADWLNGGGRFIFPLPNVEIVPAPAGLSCGHCGKPAPYIDFGHVCSDGHFWLDEATA
jgi:NDP-4-keto-2,6-dideoxyhexose 3-C-methyltransferase